MKRLSLVHGDERNARFKGASGAEVGAKRRRADARSVEEHDRRNDDEAEQDDVLAPGERTAPGALSDFGKRYLVEKVLDEAERAEPTAYRAAEKRAESEDGSDDVEGKPLVACDGRCPQAPMGMPRWRRARAVEPGNADAFRVSLVDGARCEALYVEVVEQDGEQLDDRAFEARDRTDRLSDSDAFVADERRLAQRVLKLPCAMPSAIRMAASTRTTSHQGMRFANCFMVAL